MDLVGLEAFVAIADWGSFSEAARRTGVPKSSLSRRLAELERALDARLLDRSRSAVRLTEEGEALLAPAKALLESAADIEGRLKSRADEAAGRLRVSAPNLLGQTALADIAARFARENPSVSLEIASTDRYVDLIAEGFDCAIRTSDPKNPDLICRKIFSSDLVLVARPAYAAALGATTPDELAALDRLEFSRNADRRWTLRRDAEVRRLQNEGRLRFDSLIALRRAALAMDAVALLPEFLVSADLESGRLMRVLPEWSGDTHDVFVVFPSRAYMPARLRRFIDLLATSASSGAFGAPD